MDIQLFLNDDFVEAFHTQIIPHVGEHSKTYVELAQCIALINQIVETPYFELCLQQFQAIDPGNSIPSDMLYEELSSFFELDTELTPYAVQLKQLYAMIEKEKRDLVRALRTTKLTVSTLKEKIKTFHEKKDKLCESTLYQLEFIVEKKRLEKIMISLPSFAP